MRLIFVNRFYWPEGPATGQLLTDLAEALAAAGHEVNVITSRAAGVSLPPFEVRAGVSILRLGGTRWDRAGIAGKAVDYLVCYVSMFFALLARARRSDVVIAMTDPPMLGFGAAWAARLRGAAMVHWIQDVYPEVAIALSGQTWLRVLRPMRDISWRRADACVAIGSDIATLVADAGVSRERLHVIPNRAPAGIRTWHSAMPPPLKSEWGLEGKFVVAYSGNLGRVHDLEPILEAAAKLRDRSEIVLVIIGSGPQRERLQALARDLALPNVVFRPPQPRERLNEALAIADVHLVTLRPGCERFVFPSKLQGVAALGRPILFVGPASSEPARVVREQGLGFSFERHQTEAFVETIERLARAPVECAALCENVRRFAGRESADAWLARWHAIFARVTGRPQTQPSPAQEPAS